MKLVSNFSDPVVVVCAADNNYAMPLSVTLRSAIENFKSNRRLVLFVIDGGIEEQNKQKITKTFASKQVDFQFLQPNDALLSGMQLSERFTLAKFHRLLIAELLPSHFSKAIYLDSDMIVTGNLAELWDIEIGENHVLAVQDLYIAYVSSPGGLKNYRELGIPSTQKYFNSGVLVINLNKWRTNRVGMKVITYVRDNEDILTLQDQEGLNAILAGKWGELDLRWNQITYIHNYQAWPDSQLKNDLKLRYKELADKPYVIHFTSSKKPWKPGCKHPKKIFFFYYLSMTAYANLLPYFCSQSFLDFCQFCVWKLRRTIKKLAF
jgi:lipopolysaccharide biosynthesis glycosyltransferase